MKHFTPDLAIYEDILAVYNSMDISEAGEARADIEWNAIEIQHLAQAIINDLDNKGKIVDLVADIRQSCDAIMTKVSS